MGREARSLEDWVRWHRCENVSRSTLASQKPFLPGIVKSIHPVPPELELNSCTGSIATLSHLPKAFLQSSPMCDYDESKLEITYTRRMCINAYHQQFRILAG